MSKTAIIIMVICMAWTALGVYAFFAGGCVEIEKIKPIKRIIALLVYGPFITAIFFMLGVANIAVKFSNWLENNP